MSCGGEVGVNVLAFNSDDPSSNPAKVYNSSVEIVVGKDKNEEKEVGVGPLKTFSGPQKICQK